VDHVHPEVPDREVGDRIAVGDPERDVVQPSHFNQDSDGRRPTYFRRSTACCSCALFIFERPRMFIPLASLYSCSLVRPLARFVPDRSPRRRPDDMSLRESREDSRASPVRARSLLTVRAAISFAFFVYAPCFCSASLMCSY